jgi:hypothetical protein
MVSLLVSRLRTQWPLLAALAALVAIGATVAGACALLVTGTADRAMESVATRGSVDDVDATAFTLQVAPKQAGSVAADARRVLIESFAPFPVTTTVRASSRVRALPSTSGGAARPGEAYLSGVDGLRDRGTLVSGRWPRAGASPIEAVLLEPTARMLGVHPGRRLRLGQERAFDAAPPIDVTVVGVIRPLPATGWERDPLGGQGYDRGQVTDDASDQPVPGYGPFLVDLGDLFATPSVMDRLEVVAVPDLAGARLRDLNAAAARLDGADPRLSRQLGDRVHIERVDAALPRTLAQAREQRRVADAVVFAVALLGCGLTAVALVLAGRLVSGVRAGETALMSALGVSPAQFAAAAAVETAFLAVLAAVVAAPLSALLHSGLTHLPPLSGAGLTVAPRTNLTHLLTVAAAAAALALLLAVLTIRPVATPGERGRRRADLLARSGADLLLVAFAGVAWWQLHGQPDIAVTRTDVVRATAPVLVLTAGAALALRAVPPALRGLDRLARRARGLILPLAAFEAARRPHAVAAGLLVSLACAAGTFGVALDASWERSQHDQADMATGTDLTVAVTGGARPGDGEAVTAATGGTVSPVANRGIALGQWTGGATRPPRLIAVDTAHAGALLRGRADGDQSWSQVGAALTPKTTVRGVAVPAGTTLTVSGTATGNIPIVVVPQLVLQDPTGLRTTCIGDRVPLDGTAHRLGTCATAGGSRLVAIAMPITPAAPAPEVAAAEVAVAVALPGLTAGSPWTASSAPPAAETLTDVAVTATAGRLTMSAGVQLAGAENAARTLVATAFADPGALPVAMASRVAEEIGVGPGDSLTMPVGVTPVPITVAAVVPEVPGAPGAPAVLADIDALSRSLIVNGDLRYPMDAWWVGHPARADAAERVAALHLGETSTRAGETARLAGSPPRAGVRPALRLLVLIAVLLLLAGVVLHLNSDLRIRAVEVARLRGLGMTRREVRTLLFSQHAGVLLPLLIAGLAVGALGTALVAPPMIRAETGAAPVPSAVPIWPWAAEAALLGALAGACALAVIVLVIVHTRRADAAHLRVAT